MSKVVKRKHERDSKSWASLPWTKVNLSLDGVTDGQGITDEEFLNAPNHYDDDHHADPNDLYSPSDAKVSNNHSKKKTKRSKEPKDTDRDIVGADDPGIILGLEVIDGSKYRVEKIPSKTGGYVSRLVWNNPHQNDDEKNTKTTEGTSYPTPQRQQQGSDDAITTEKSGTNNTQSQKSLPKGGDDSKEKNKKQISKIKSKVDDEVNVPKKHLPSKSSKVNNLEMGDKGTKDKGGAAKIDPEVDNHPTQDKIDETQMSWAVATGGVYLHNHICVSLAKMGFSYPTPIQASTLSASVLGKRDIAGAAPTGSGKTLAYLIPILQFFLEEKEITNVEESGIKKAWPLTALILCPTRELALQVSQEFEKLSRNVVSCGTIVGGLSEEKQKRILDVKRPPLLVCCPGRLWSLMSSQDHKHLNDLSKLRFLVIDEVDRMISKGNYPQLVDIFDAINKANPVSLDGETMLAKLPKEGADNDDDTRLKSLEGVPGEAQVIMLDDEILRKIEYQKQGSAETMDEDDDGDDYSNESSLNFKAVPDSHPDDEQSDEDSDSEEIIHRQTFVFSATLSLPPSSNQFTKKTMTESNKKKKRTETSMTIHGTIHDFLKTAGARGQLKFVDLSSDQPQNSQSNQKSKSFGSLNSDPVSSIQLPPGLSIYEIPCTKKHKDSHLYAFLTTTEQGSSGPCLIFCNSIAAVKRVGQTLRVLGLPARTLHGQMEQKSRLSVIDTLKGKDSRLIVVATDVAARGIDLPSVATIIHYDVARAVNTFIHRAGRTARGVGSAAVGTSISLVDPSEDKEHKKICETLQGQGKRHFELSSIDGHLLAAAQTRVALATKIVDCEQIQNKSMKNNNWMRQAAADADLDVDEDLLDNGLANGSLRDQHRLNDAAKARSELKQLLARPMKKQHFGKFLSGAGIQKSLNSSTAVQPFVVKNATTAGTKRKRRRGN